MIIDKTINIRVHNTMLKHYRSLGYECQIGDIIEISPSDLTNSSIVILNVKCDICGFEKKLTYEKYNKNIKNLGLYCCSQKCADIKTKSTKLKNHGDENYNNREKSIETCQKVYGVDNVQQVKEIKEKTNLTNENRYGNKILMHNQIIKDKVKQTKIDTYGENYGELIYEKAKETMNIIYGDENYNNREQSIETCQMLYGVDNVMQIDEIKKKMVKTKQDTGQYRTDEERTKFRNYWLSVKRVTNKNKPDLLKNWDGLDYYDKEYIKENYTKFDSKHREYPTIDHKISVFYGFKNDILPEEIGKLENLCITKRCINSSKHIKNIYNID